ncbi:MAG: formylglycine-generating enzyme family protein [Saprospiraceae bacterium]|nr:formylglycine-generating enzyme family protein [Saprospiraceae bacterium]
MVYVEGGTFLMGCDDSRDNVDGGCDTDEKPAHKVSLHSFYIGRYELTQGEWIAVMGMGSNPSSFSGCGNNCPVETVSWYDALIFCNKLSMKNSKMPVYKINNSADPQVWGSPNATWDAVQMDLSANGYRLPTEAEWEYAARGGQSSLDYPYPGGNNADEVGWNSENPNTMSTTHPRGMLKPNELGIYDMSGNVWEWCWDWHKSDFYQPEQCNPMNNTPGSFRVCRGGGWYDDRQDCRSASRGSSTPVYRDSFLGLRLASSQ